MITHSIVQENHWPGLALRALILVPVAVVALRTDIGKFRGWRQRIREWGVRGSVVPPEYQRDNELWRWRLAALAICLGGLAASAVLVLGANPPRWLFWSVYAAAMIGAAGWNLLGAHVR